MERYGSRTYVSTNPEVVQYIDKALSQIKSEFRPLSSSLFLLPSYFMEVARTMSYPPAFSNLAISLYVLMEI